MSTTEPEFEIAPNRHLRRALAPAAAACACVGGLAFVYGNNPSTPGAAFLTCPLYATTGIWCPGCGLTRATYRLIHGDVLGALAYNALLPIVILLAVGAWWAWMRSSLGRPLRRSIMTVPTWTWTALLVVLVAFGVVRNLPFAATRALAP